MSRLRVLSFVCAAVGIVAVSIAWRPVVAPSIRASDTEFEDVLRHHARGGILGIMSDTSGVTLELDRAWNPDTGEGHDDAKHGRLAEVGDDWVRIDHPLSGSVFVATDRVVIQRPR